MKKDGGEHGLFSVHKINLDDEEVAIENFWVNYSF